MSERLEGSIDHHAPDAFARVHEVEALVDLLEGEHVGDHRVDHAKIEPGRAEREIIDTQSADPTFGVKTQILLPSGSRR